MKSRFLAGPVAAAAFVLCASICKAGVLVPIPLVPGSTATYTGDINNNNVIAGSYTTADGVSHGYFGTLNGNYTTFDVPDGTGGPGPLDDEGNLIGETNPSQTCIYGGCGWRRDLDRSIKLFSKSHAPIDGVIGDVSGKSFVGDYRYIGDDGFFHVVPYVGKGTKYVADISLPFDTIHASVRGFHGSRFVEGWFRDRDDGNRDRGFVMKDGVAKAYDYPDESAFITQFERMNNKGLIAGSWYDGEQTYGKAFLFNWRNEKFLPITLSGTYVYAASVNDAGLAIIGADDTSYLYCPHKKACPIHSASAIEVPDKWIAARNVEERVCPHGCWQPHLAAAVKTVSPLATRAAIARDPELQRELHLPLR
jgi:hypothetical protein